MTGPNPETELVYFSQNVGNGNKSFSLVFRPGAGPGSWGGGKPKIRVHVSVHVCERDQWASDPGLGHRG